MPEKHEEPTDIGVVSHPITGYTYKADLPVETDVRNTLHRWRDRHALICEELSIKESELDNISSEADLLLNGINRLDELLKQHEPSSIGGPYEGPGPLEVPAIRMPRHPL